MGARQHAGLGNDRAHRLDVAAVDADAVVEDVPAHDLGLGFLELCADLVLREGGDAVRGLGDQRGDDLGLDRVDRLVALGLGGDLVGSAQIGLADLHDRVEHGGIVRGLEVARLLGGLLGQADDRVDHRLEVLVAEHHGAEHDLLGQLLGLGFDHQHGVLRAGDDEVEGRFLHFLDQRVELVGAVDIADARRADRTHERHARKRQRRRGRDHRDDVGIVLKVMLQDGDDDLGVVLVALDEEGADRPVDQARDQRFLLGRASLALEIAARNAAGGEGLLLVIHGQGEEVEARLRLLGRDDGGEHDGLAIGGEHGAVGLAGDLAGFEHELAPAPDQLFGLYIEHRIVFRSDAIRPASIVPMGKTAKRPG